MNTLDVPILDGPNQSLILAHKDFDGVVGCMVGKKWIINHCGPNHTVEFRGCTYEVINELAKEYFAEAHEYRYIFIIDISINQEVLKILPKNAFIFDHHSTSQFIENHPNCYWSEKYCGGVVAWKGLFKNTKKPEHAFGKLLSLSNSYDMWICDETGFPPQDAMNLNVLQRKYGYSDFFNKFYDGFTQFDEIDRAFIDQHWRNQHEAIKTTDTLEYGDDVLLMIFNDDRLDPNYWCTKYLQTKKAVIIYYTESSRLSLRINKCLKGKFHGGFFLQKNINNSNNSKGGHELASGCSCLGMSVDQILDIGNTLHKEIQDIQ